MGPFFDCQMYSMQWLLAPQTAKNANQERESTEAHCIVRQALAFVVAEAFESKSGMLDSLAVNVVIGLVAMSAHLELAGSIANDLAFTLQESPFNWPARLKIREVLDWLSYGGSMNPMAMYAKACNPQVRHGPSQTSLLQISGQQAAELA